MVNNNNAMAWDQIKDYANSFIAILILGIPLIVEAIKSNRSKFLIILYIFCCVGLSFLGIDKIKRDNNKEASTETKRLSDSSTIHNITSKLDTLSNNYNRDTTRFSRFKKDLLEQFYIKDSLNKPIQINDLRTINTHINRARDVTIGL